MTHEVHTEHGSYNLHSSFTFLPSELNARVDLIYGCLETLRQIKADKEHAAEIAKQEQAQREANRVAMEAAKLEEEQAKREAESQARVNAEKLAAAKASLVRVAEVERIKTQALVDDLATKVLIAEQLELIIKTRLMGTEERAKITNDWLKGRDRAAADFDEQAAAIEARSAEYDEFNKALLSSIEAHRTRVNERLENARRIEAEQIAELERLQKEAIEAVLPTPTATAD